MEDGFKHRRDKGVSSPPKLIAMGGVPTPMFMDFINAYMNSKTRASIDSAQAYVNTMDAKELFDYFVQTDHYTPVNGKALDGFMPDWIGKFYAYYQWLYNLPSSEVIKKIPLSFLTKAYAGLHDLDLKLAVEKVGGQC